MRPRGERRAEEGGGTLKRAPRVLAAVLLASAAAAQPVWYSVVGDDAGSWPQIFAAAGFQPQAGGGPAQLIVVRQGAKGSAARWLEAGATLILEGSSEVAESLGFRAGAQRVQVQSVEDVHRPELRILWEKPVELPRFELPAEARLFARERWNGAPLAAGLRRGAGAVLWLAAPPGERGYERFPYVLHALRDLGIEPPFQGRRLWAFFDSSYRSRADLEYLARRWRQAGIAALHVAGWHYFEADADRDAFLRRLIETCHRHAILVYCWLELPHVSESFWREHPQWREKTAILQDAHLDWRKLMNLANRDCARAAMEGVRELVGRFDWDGVNLAELYFESLEGAANPARFTPMNDDVRREFERQKGFDPLELFSGKANAERLRVFLDYRAELARRIQAEWIGEMDGVRRVKPHLDMVLTHVDDQFEPGTRDAVGADAARVLPLLEQHEFTFLVEDPATIWHLGPQRYPEIARRYRPLTRRTDKLAIDINIVERYQDVYPTKQQTGTELLALLNAAARSFPRVALYFESSILTPDLPLLAAATAAVTRVERLGEGLLVESSHGAGVPWKGPALVDGKPWPATDGGRVWLPAGAHRIEPAAAEPPVRILDFNGEMKEASVVGPNALEIAYMSYSRAMAVLDREPVGVEVDGVVSGRDHRSLWSAWQTTKDDRLPHRSAQPVTVLRLPRGQHLVTLRFE
jgi:hypothetical protein